MPKERESRHERRAAVQAKALLLPMLRYARQNSALCLQASAEVCCYDARAGQRRGGAARLSEMRTRVMRDAIAESKLSLVCYRGAANSHAPEARAARWRAI